MKTTQILSALNTSESPKFSCLRGNPGRGI